MLLSDCKPGDLISMEDGKAPVYEVGPVSQCDTREVRKTGKWEGQAFRMGIETKVVPWEGRRPTLRGHKHLAEAKRKGLLR